MRKHVLRNALGPIVTVVGLQVGTLPGGTVLVEYVFSWPWSEQPSSRPRQLGTTPRCKVSSSWSQPYSSS